MNHTLATLKLIVGGCSYLSGSKGATKAPFALRLSGTEAAALR